MTFFEPQKKLPFDELRLPMAKELETSQEKFTAVYFFLTQMFDYLQGDDNEYTYHTRRPHLDRPRSRTVLEDLQGKDLLSCFQEGDPAPEDREKCEDPADGSPEVVGEASKAA